MLKDILDNVNLIYIFLSNFEDEQNKLNLANKNLIEKLRKKYKFNQRKFVSYRYNNLEYTYELLNDNQCLFKYDLLNLKNENNLILMYNEVKLPIYMFPSIKNISYKDEYILEENKINNRITLNIKHDTVYISFNYSINCDLDNNIKIIEKLIKEII